jgi:hypothetical protein
LAWWPQWDSLEGQREGGQEREGEVGEEAGSSAHWSFGGWSTRSVGGDRKRVGEEGTGGVVGVCKQLAVRSGVALGDVKP